jgi:putative addiction module CopG family antidote
MTLSLGPELERFIEEKVRTGQYASREDVVRAGLTTLMQHDRLEQLPLADLEAIFPGFRGKIAAGVAEARAGKLSDGDTFFDELERQDQETGP